MGKPSKMQVVGGLLIGIALCSIGYGFYWWIGGWAQSLTVHEEQMLIIETKQKSTAGEAFASEYFIFTDKGYFRVGGPTDEHGIPYAWQSANNQTGKLVTVKYYGEGLHHVEAWGWYRTIFEVHTINSTTNQNP